MTNKASGLFTTASIVAALFAYPAFAAQERPVAALAPALSPVVDRRGKRTPVAG